MELKGDVHIILMIPPRSNPIIMGDCSVASVIVVPICDITIFTPGSTKITIALAIGAMRRAPPMMSIPVGSFFSIRGAKKPTNLSI